MRFTFGFHTALRAASLLIAAAVLTPANATVITAFPSDRTVQAGTQFTEVVATFEDDNPAATPADFTATIDWGDATAPSAGTISPNSAGFIVLGTHTYAMQGTFTVTVTIFDSPPGTGTATVTDTFTVTASADVSVTKSGPASVTAGNNVTYTVTVANGGPNDAQSVMLSDALPGGTTFVSEMQATGPMFTCMNSSGNVNCSIATLAKSASATFQIVYKVGANVQNSGAIINTAFVSSPTPDPNANNNGSQVSTPVSASADLSVSKTGPASVTAGNNITYTVTFVNNGPSDAQSVMLSDALPPGTTFVSEMQATGPAFTCMNPSLGSGGTVSCSIATLANGASASFTIVYKVSATVSNGTMITNSATGSSTTADSNPNNNTGSSTAIVGVSADLSVTKTGPATVSAGNNVTYTVTVVNNGPSDAQSVMLSDALPPGTTFVSEMQTVGPAFNCMNPSVGSGGTVSCTITTLANGASAAFTIVIKVGSTVPNGTMITNSATGSSTTADPNPNNNTGSSTAIVGVSADLSVTKTGPASVNAGSNITYTLTVMNNGPSDAQSVMLSDALPPGTTFVSEMQTVGPTFNCTNPSVGSGGTVSCTIATLANGASATFTIVYKVSGTVPNGTMITNSATGSSTTADPNPNNNTGTSTATAGVSADLSVNNTGAASVNAGSNITYTVTVVNNGPSDAQSVMLSDTVPTNTTFVSGMQTTGPAFTCMNPSVGSGGTVSCSIATLANGASASFTIVNKVGSTVANGTMITNSATGSSTTADPNPNNNTGTSTAFVGASADLSVTKTGPATANASNNITYTVSVTNNGPSDAQSVMLSDSAPTNTTFVSEMQTVGPAFTCMNPSVGGTGAVSCSIATLANGASASFTLVYKVGASVPNGTTITNTATVSSTTPDPNPANNSASSSANASGSADLSVTKGGPATVTSGQNIVYTIVVTNNGPGPATGVTVSDPTPSGTTFVSNAGACTTPFPCNLGTLTNGQSVTITATYSVNAGAANGSTVTNTATVSSPVPDPNPNNNSATSSATVGISADVSVIKTGPAAVTFNTNGSYQIVVSNAGPSNSQNVVVTDVIPSNASFVSATPSQGSCSGTATVTCSLGTINAGSSATIALVLHVNSGTGVTNTATVTADTPDPNLANNSSTTGVIPVTPLPSSLILIIVGLGGLGIYRARRRLAGRA
jgi:uncharacterized repeat protein (TIGR01451 family)